MTAELEVEHSGIDQFLAIQDVLEQLDGDSRVLSSLTPAAPEAHANVSKPFMKLVEVEADAQIVLVNAAGERQLVLKLPVETTMSLLRKEL